MPISQYTTTSTFVLRINMYIMAEYNNGDPSAKLYAEQDYNRKTHDTAVHQCLLALPVQLHAASDRRGHPGAETGPSP